MFLHNSVARTIMRTTPENTTKGLVYARTTRFLHTTVKFVLIPGFHPFHLQRADFVVIDTLIGRTAYLLTRSLATAKRILGINPDSSTGIVSALVKRHGIMRRHNKTGNVVVRNTVFLVFQVLNFTFVGSLSGTPLKMPGIAAAHAAIARIEEHR
ncbi:MAG: hypothetical protein CMK92_04585 [Pseudomonas sp.]|nr:hypothetical protein [Pseudomonas sp.]